jgi:CheY-like chemotaxis protein
MDGWETAHAIRAQRPLPLVYLRGDADAATMGRAQESGAAGYLQTPAAEGLLHAMLRQVLLPPSPAQP